jgi:CBS domain-containing protein
MATLVFAKDVYSKEFNTVQENDNLSKCLEAFKTGSSPVLAVLNEKGKYVGMINRRTVIRSRLDPGTTKVKNLTKAAPVVSGDYSLSKLAKLMIESGTRQLAVFEKNKLLGFVTDENIIHAAVIGEWGSVPVEKIMTRAPHTIDDVRSVGAVLSLMREFEVSHVPVMREGKLVGLVSVSDVMVNIFSPQIRQTTGDIVGEKIETLSVPVRGIMSSPAITVTTNTTLRDAERLMHKRDISCLCVVSGVPNERLVGVVTKLDFLEPISQLEHAEKKLSVQFGTKGIEISEEQQGFMMTEFDSFVHKYQEAFQLGTLFVYMKSHGSTEMRGTPLIHCRLQFRTARGTFFSASEGWGVEPTFRVALDRMDRRLLRSKELLAYNPKFAKDYLRKYGLPSEEE